MSQVSNKFYSEMGEINYDKCCEQDDSNLIASHILNDILETAMDIAINTNPMTESKKMNIIDEHEEYSENCSELKDIIDGLSKINIGNLMPKPNPEEPLTLDVEMKRLLNEMMSPPFEIVNYENIPRKDGVGDQAAVARQDQAESHQLPEKESDEPQADKNESKVVEKKSRVTDLVMNSKKVLSNLLDEEGRKKLEEWEESNEHVIQVIELQNQKDKHDEVNPDHIPLPHDDHEEDLIEKVDERQMVSVELRGDEGYVDGTGEDRREGLERKSSVMKKKKWHFSFKFFGFKRKNNKQEN